MEEKGLPCRKGETKSRVTHKNQTNLNNGGKSHNKHKWGQRKLGILSNKEKSMGKELPTKNAKQDLSKVKCFNCDNNGHLAKDYIKPPQVQVSTFPKVS